MNRFFQILLISSTLALSWLGMMVVHELGHVLVAYSSGVGVQHVYLHPLGLSYTLFSTNPPPLYVVWGGPILGCLIPLILLAAVRFFAKKYAYLTMFFAAFCLIANGAYLAGGLLYGSDTLDDGSLILNLGGDIWQLVIFALVTIAVGFYMLNGLGKHFGITRNRNPQLVDRHVAITVTLIIFVLVVVELIAFWSFSPF